VITLDFKVDGELFGTIEVPEDSWELGGALTYEKAFIRGHLTRPEKTGYYYTLFLERPVAAVREAKAALFVETETKEEPTREEGAIDW